MKKSDLRFGNILVLRDGTKCLLHPIRNYRINDVKFTEYNENILRNLKNGTLIDYLCSYDEYFNNRFDNQRDIIEIYEDYTMNNLLWERGKNKDEKK